MEKSDNDLIILQQVFSQEEALDIENILTQKGVYCKIVWDESSFDPATGITSEDKVTVQVNRKDFENARNILIHEFEKQSFDVETEHYLNSFSIPELYDVIQREDEWSAEDVVIARQILKNKGEVWNEDEVFEKNEKLRWENDKPEKIPFLNLIAGYFFALLGGLFGFLIGIYIITLKKTDRNGLRVYYYDEESRKSGKIIFIIGLIWFLISIMSLFFWYR